MTSQVSPFIWFRLVNKDGQPFQNTTPTTVLRASLVAPMVDQFRKAVHREFAHAELKNVSAPTLKVFVNSKALKENVPMEEDALIDAEHGATKNTALLVTVPTPVSDLLVRGIKRNADSELSGLASAASAPQAVKWKSASEMPELPISDSNLLPNGDEFHIHGSSTSVSDSESSDNSMSVANIRTDGIDMYTQHLDRKKLVETLITFTSLNFISLLASPAGSGKTSLCQLYKAACKKTKVIEVSLLQPESPFDLLKSKGIDLLEQKFHDKLAGKRQVVVILDDAQEKYGDLTFWNLLVKTTASWLPRNIRFIISGTHSLAGRPGSPVEFESLPRLSRSDFLLTDEESYQFLNSSCIGLPKTMSEFQTLKDVLVRGAGGLIAALRLSVDALKNAFIKDTQPTETDVLQYSLTKQFIQNMARCFGTRHAKPIGDDFKVFLRKCYMNENIRLDGLQNVHDAASFDSLEKAGILVQQLPDLSFKFSSQFAKMFYFDWVFPKRSPSAPSSLPELIRDVISSMSSSVLRNSTVPGSFPKEAVFQHLFMEGLALFTIPESSICPELSTVFPKNPKNNPTNSCVPGEIDFYLNGNLRWGIELLINGEGIGEHMARFEAPNGKYFALNVNDYAVIDFRGNSSGNVTNVSRLPKRYSVFFKQGDYTSATCVFGDDPNNITIKLAD